MAESWWLCLTIWTASAYHKQLLCRWIIEFSNKKKVIIKSNKKINVEKCFFFCSIPIRSNKANGRVRWTFRVNSLQNDDNCPTTFSSTILKRMKSFQIKCNNRMPTKVHLGNDSFGCSLCAAIATAASCGSPFLFSSTQNKSSTIAQLSI